MANVRDSDTSLWLHNKLGTSNDSWTGGSICSQLNAEVLRNIKDCFPDLQTQVKLKLLLSFFHIPRRNVEEWHTELEEILEVAQVDSEQWVSMLAEMMKTLPGTGSLNTDIGDVDENRRIFSDLVNDLRKLVKRQCDMEMLPLECHYLNKSALISVVGQQPPPTKHFTLKRKPKSAALRAELLQKSADAASNFKKSTAPTVPLRSRGMPRKMTDTTPLKGIPSRVPAGGFRSTSLNSPSLSRPPLSRTPAGRKDGGIKLLDINEQPLGYAQAKKRKRMQELEEAKKASEAAAAATAAAQQLPQQNQQLGTSQSTPDYAVGLTAMNPPTPAPATPSYSPATPQHPVTTIIAIPRDAAANPQPSLTLQTSGGLVATPVVTAVQTQAGVTTPTKQVIQIRPAPQVTQIRIQPVNATPGSNNTLQRKGGLSLTREQMLEAQEMFRTANKVTRPEKALILGFMAGSRDNPCPHLGNIVTIKLSEDQEIIPQPDDTFVTTTVETHFQMNYNTGEWKRIKKPRKIEDPSAVIASSTPVSTPLPATSATAT
ncbi:hypothetical protein Cfor_10863 [Coptotermes formosanus]|uniref:HDAg domain-containing protein n=1 Tax=Coptotermes formosanus TaxID=36987 RepID=A0A6L2PJX5_COPFO|nr:hypothetical protein Cfor_10863 [Coptotermes formosanus]